jgi:hypothetical protein
MQLEIYDRSSCAKQLKLKQRFPRDLRRRAGFIGAALQPEFAGLGVQDRRAEVNEFCASKRFATATSDEGRCPLWVLAV